jgi:hypothetical protein
MSEMDTVTEVTSQNVFQRFINSVFGILFGIAIFIGSFVLLFYNEGRPNLANIANKASNISSQEIDQSKLGQLVYTTDNLITNTKIGDSTFLKEDNYLGIKRQVEMYSWVENQKTTTEKKVGGTEEKTTTYSYSKEWTTMPKDTASFKNKEGKINPPLKYQSQSSYNPDVKIGIYNVDLQKGGFGNFTPVSPNIENSDLSKEVTARIEANYIFIPLITTNTFDKPEIGDLKISYSVINNGQEATTFGKLEKNGEKTSINSYLDPKSNSLVYAIRSGNKDMAIKTLDNEHNLLLWGLRFLGFMLMWFGLMSFFEPFGVILDVLPIFGNIGRFLYNAIAFIIALVLSTITILISLIVHNIYILILTILAVIALTFYIYNKKKQVKSV